MRISITDQCICSIVSETDYTFGQIALSIILKSLTKYLIVMLSIIRELYKDMSINLLLLESIILPPLHLLYLNLQYLKKKRSLIILCLVLLKIINNNMRTGMMKNIHDQLFSKNKTNKGRQ